MEHAVILAAGTSSRLYPLTHHLPKCLLPVGGFPLLEHQLIVLQESGFRSATVVVGYHRDKIERFLRTRMFPRIRTHTILNREFDRTNNFYSLFVCRERLEGRPFLVTHADLLFHPGILERTLRARGHICLTIDKEIVEETMKVRLRGRRVEAVSKAVPPQEAHGTFLGMATFSAEGSELLFRALEKLLPVARRSYFTAALEALIQQAEEVSYATTGGLPWIEIDYPEELKKAEEEVFPQILRSL
ncbi:MAG: phosphocholine cytidylyltransferase family protein [Acidobacteria bacterium]|nr:phosphocholine cytidylyltransferase family protein [Acidobacteriota bacterium]